MSAPTRFAGTTGHPGQAAKMETKTGICVGMVGDNADYGKIVTKLPLKQRPSTRKGKLNKRVALVKEVIREVAGFSPYEKRTMELLKVGKEKRALKLLKAKLGTQLRLANPAGSYYDARCCGGIGSAYGGVSQRQRRWLTWTQPTASRVRAG